ncbi:MAG: CDP-alcohol phosphatidyltransferase family protein [Candidatus Micrarchaeota archaeon]|nr:CDP-alcohol phosphatidyltransferase family protein [Candidatus Micrarchaeota archaeon]
MIKGNFAEFAEYFGTKLGMLFARIPLTPNQWTLLSIVPAIIGFWALAFAKRMDYAIICFAASALIDGIDGGVARVTGAVTRLGAYLDGIMDRIVEALLLFGLMFYGIPDYHLPSYVWISALLFFGTGMTSYARAYADHRKALTDEKKLRRMGGILERPERLVLIVAGMVAGFWNPLYLTYAIAAGAALSMVTVLQRIWFVVRNAE